MLPRILAACILLASFAAADVKAKTRVTASGATVETTTLVKGSRVRQEPVAASEDPQIVRIYQCDLDRLVLLNPKNQAFRVVGLEYAREDPESAPARPTRPSRSGSTITLTTTVTDTGEKRKIMDRTARGINTETVAAGPPGACSTARHARLSSRGWYVDLPGIDASCADPNLAGLRLRPAEPECSDRVTFRMKGNLPQGLPLLIESTLGTSEGEVSMKQEMVGIAETELDAALFDIPAGYRRVQTQEELLHETQPPAPEGLRAVDNPARSDRATRTGEPRPELTRVCVVPPLGIEPERRAGAQLRLGALLNRQGLQAVTVGPEEKNGSCRFNVAVEKVTKGGSRFTYRVTAASPPGKTRMGSVPVKPDMTEDEAWERLAKAVAGQILKTR